MRWLRRWWDTTKKVALEPKKFFSRMPTKGGYKEPIKFLLATFAIEMALLIVLISVVSLFSPVGFMSVGPQGTAVIGAVTLVLLPFIIIFSLAAWAIIYLLATAFILLVMKIIGGKGTFQGTFRVLAYISPLTMLTLIPFIGAFAWLYVFYVEARGLSYAHKVSFRRTLIAFIILGLIGLLVGFWIMGGPMEYWNAMMGMY